MRAMGSDTAPEVGDQVAGNAEHLLLGAVGVGDEAPLEHVRSARDGAQGRRDQTAGAAFGGDDAQGRSRASSMTSRARVSISRENMSATLDRRGDRRHRLRGHALAAAGEAELFGGGRLDADATDREGEEFGDPRAHGLAVRLYLRRFADQRDIDIDDLAPPSAINEAQHVGGTSRSPRLSI